MRSQLCQVNLPHHILSLHSHFFQIWSILLKLLSLILTHILSYQMILYPTSQRKQMLSDKKFPQPNTQTFLLGHPFILLYSYKSTNIFSIWSLDPTATYYFQNLLLLFTLLFSIFTTFLQLICLCFRAFAHHQHQSPVSELPYSSSPS